MEIRTLSFECYLLSYLINEIQRSIAECVLKIRNILMYYGNDKAPNTWVSWAVGETNYLHIKDRIWHSI